MPLAKRKVHLTFRASQLAFLILPQRDRCYHILTPLEKSQAKAAWCDGHLAHFWSLSLSLNVLFDNLSCLSFWVRFQAAHPRWRAKQLPVLHLFPSFKKIEKAIATCFLPLMPIFCCRLHRSNLLYCFIICYACQQAASWFPWVFSINPAGCIAQWLPNHNRFWAPLDESWHGCPHLLA